jgi:hypothetical protein
MNGMVDNWNKELKFDRSPLGLTYR